MRADELMKVEMLLEGVWTFGTFTDYINQLRVDRLTAKAREFKLYCDTIGDNKFPMSKYQQLERIAEALEAKAKRIKEGM